MTAPATGHLAPDERWSRGDPYVQEVADNTFAYVQPDGSWHINTMGFVVGHDGVTVVDTTSTERRTRAFLEAITTVTPRSPRMLINTHHHGDHTYGNCLLPEATVIGHRKCRDLILATGIQLYEGVFEHVDHGNLEPHPPEVTFEDQLTLWVGDLRLELLFTGGPAHTTNDVVVWIPDRSVLFAGDLVFNRGTPFLLMGSLAGAMASLEWLRDLDPAIIVPGHGPVCGTEALADMAAYYRLVEDTAKAGKAEGLTPLEAARQADLTPFAHLCCPERLVGNLHRAYFELDGGEPGAPIPLGPAIEDMVAYNGGRPLACLA